MNQHMAEGRWQQLSGKIKQKWGKLTDDDLTRAAGDREYLVGKLHEQYGIARDRAENELATLGYSEHDEDRDLRSSDRSSAGRMDLAGETGSGRKLQAGFANAGSPGSGLDDQGEASGYEQSRDSRLGNRDQGASTGSGYRKLYAGGAGESDVDSQGNVDNGSDRRGGESQEAADYEPAGHTLEAAPGTQESPSGSNAGPGGSPSSPQRSGGQQQKSGRNTPGAGNR